VKASAQRPRKQLSKVQLLGRKTQSGRKDIYLVRKTSELKLRTKDSWRRIANSPQNSKAKSLKQENKTLQKKQECKTKVHSKNTEKKVRVLTPNIGCGQTRPVGSQLTQNRNVRESEQDEDGWETSQS